MTFKDRLDEFLLREFKAHINELLGGSKKPSSALHAQVAHALEDLRLLAQNSLDTAKTQIGALVNQLSPLDCLPDDILQLIFQQFDNRTTFFAAKVSRRWRALAHSVPLLWANIELSCRSDQFEQQFGFFAKRSQNVPLDIKLVMESTKIYKFRGDVDDSNYVQDLLLQQCRIDLKRQFERGVKHLALAPDILARTRTLDITSIIDTFDHRRWHVSRVQQPPQQLHLAASHSLRRLRLNWARPEIHELQLILPVDQGAFESVTSLSLCAVLDLREILPRFGGVLDLSLWMFDEEADIELADICGWMPLLQRLEVVDVPEVFASRPVVSHPTLKRLALHGTHICEIVSGVADQLDIDAIPEVAFWNLSAQEFQSEFLLNKQGPAVELSVVEYFSETRMEIPAGGWRTNFHFCVDDCRGKTRALHSNHLGDCYPAVATFEIINFNMVVFKNIRLQTMPLLTTLRIQGVFNSLPYSARRRDTSPGPVSCPALAHLELYLIEPEPGPYETNKASDVTGSDVLEWISNNLKDFTEPLLTLRVVGVDFNDGDVGALNDVAQTVLFTPSPLVETRPSHSAPFPAQLCESLQVLVEGGTADGH